MVIFHGYVNVYQAEYVGLLPEIPSSDEKTHRGKEHPESPRATRCLQNPSPGAPGLEPLVMAMAMENIWKIWMNIQFFTIT